MAKQLGLKVSPDTLLNISRATPLPKPLTPRVLGVDDFALKRRAKYGTILLDLERREVIELLPDRQTETFEAWLREHPGIEIISRYRGGTYARAARSAAPQAVQVADRFHIHQNLSEVVERIVRRCYPKISQILAMPKGQLSLPQENEPRMPEKLAEADLVAQSLVLSDLEVPPILAQATSEGLMGLSKQTQTKASLEELPLNKKSWRSTKLSKDD